MKILMWIFGGEYEASPQLKIEKYKSNRKLLSLEHNRDLH